MSTGPRLGWREIVISVAIPLLLAVVWVWRFSDLSAGDQGIIGVLSAVAVALGALFGFRRVLGSMRTRASGRSGRQERVPAAVGMVLAITGVVLLRLIVPDALILVGVAATAGMLGAAIPAVAAARR